MSDRGKCKIESVGDRDAAISNMACMISASGQEENSCVLLIALRNSQHDSAVATT